MISTDTCTNRVKSSKRKDGETNSDIKVRMMDSLPKWLKIYNTVDKVHRVLGVEQLLGSLSVEKC